MSFVSLASVPSDAHVVIAASSSTSTSMVAVAVGWPHASMTFLRGRDGADLALIAVALEENVAVFSRAAYLSNKLRDVCAYIRTFSARDFALAA